MSINYTKLENTQVQVWPSAENTVILHTMKVRIHRGMKRLGTLVLILLMGSLMLNQALYTHSHVMPDGSIVSHAHPFNKSQESKQGASHHHSALEFLLLDNLNVLIFSISALSVWKSFSMDISFQEQTIEGLLPSLVFLLPERAPPTCR